MKSLSTHRPRPPAGFFKFKDMKVIDESEDTPFEALLALEMEIEVMKKGTITNSDVKALHGKLDVISNKMSRLLVDISYVATTLKKKKKKKKKRCIIINFSC